MPRQRFVPLPTADSDGEPFSSTEEAWFWTVKAQRLIEEGAHIRANISKHPKNCEPRDILCVISRLTRQGKLRRQHLRTLYRFGLEERCPDPEAPEDAPHATFWEQAIGCLGTALHAKGFVVPNRFLEKNI